MSKIIKYKVVINKKKHKQKNSSLPKQYEVINSTYDQQMAAIQTVITISTTISSAILVVICTQDDLVKTLLATAPNKEVLPLVILLFVATILNLCCLISIKVQISACEVLRKELHSIENKHRLYPMHRKNKLKLSFIVTILGSLTNLVAFLFLLVVALV